MLSERRNYYRVREEDEISYSVLPDYKRERKITKDLSLGGIRFIADNFIKLNSFIKVEMKLSHAQKIIHAIAKIKWVRVIFDDELYEMGAEFVDINASDLRFLGYYLAQRA